MSIKDIKECLKNESYCDKCEQHDKCYDETSDKKIDFTKLKKVRTFDPSKTTNS